MPAHLTRRALLGGTGLVVLAGCTRGGDAQPTRTADPETDDRIRSTTAGDEATLVALYDRTIERHPQLRDALAPLRDQHAEHLSALGVEGSASGDVSVPDSPAAAVKALSNAERDAADQRMSSALDAGDQQLVRLLSLISASEASHVAAMRGVG